MGDKLEIDCSGLSVREDRLLKVGGAIGDTTYLADCTAGSWCRRENIRICALL